MQNANNKTGLAVLLLLPLIGMFGLYLSEVAHLLPGLGAVADEPADFSVLPPFELIMILLMVAMLPIFLLVLKWTAASRWLALIIVALMLVFHLLHIVEHAMMADLVVSIWIALSSALPNALALPGIWRDKP